MDAAQGSPRRHAGVLLPARSTITTRFLTSELVALAALTAVRVAPVSAHHSFAAEFDGSKPVTLEGVVTQVDWANPHVWFYITMKDEEGRTARWACEMGAPH